MGADDQARDSVAEAVEDFTARFENAADWDQRAMVVRSVAEEVGRQTAREVYASLAGGFYVPALTPAHAHTFWREDYALATFRQAYEEAYRLTIGFSKVGEDDLAKVLKEKPETLLVFRTIVGYTPPELEATGQEVADAAGLTRPTKATIRRMESGKRPRRDITRALARTIRLLMEGGLYEPEASGMQVKQNKPDTAEGWESVRQFAAQGVSYDVFLHQRHYGGAFRALLDATSGSRGDALEEPVSALLAQYGVPHVRPTSDNIKKVREQLGIRVRPAPDLIMTNSRESAPIAILECKATNDGGTARDKAARFDTLAGEANRLRIALFGVLSGYGWKRTGDALGPVVEACEGRVFTPGTLDEMISVHPVSDAVGTAT